jgi:hypothetical protein
VHCGYGTNKALSTRHLRQDRVVFSKVFVVVGIHDSVRGIADSQALRSALAISIIVSSTVRSKVEGFVDDGSSLGYGITPQ